MKYFLGKQRKNATSKTVIRKRIKKEALKKLKRTKRFRAEKEADQLPATIRPMVLFRRINREGVRGRRTRVPRVSMRDHKLTTVR